MKKFLRSLFDWGPMFVSGLALTLTLVACASALRTGPWGTEVRLRNETPKDVKIYVAWPGGTRQRLAWLGSLSQDTVRWGAHPMSITTFFVGVFISRDTVWGEVERIALDEPCLDAVVTKYTIFVNPCLRP